MPSPTPVLGHGDVAGQRRSAERAQVERQDDVALGQLGRDRSRRLELDPVPLAIIDRQREHAEARLARQRRADHRIEPAREQDDRVDFRLAAQSSRRPRRRSAHKRRAARQRQSGPVIGLEPDWEESVPNPARSPLAELVKRRLNGRGNSRASPTGGLKHIIERRIRRRCPGSRSAASAASAPSSWSARTRRPAQV